MKALQNAEKAVRFINDAYSFLKNRTMALGVSDEEFHRAISYPDFDCHSMADVLETYACIAQDKTMSSNIIKFAQNKQNICKCLFDWDYELVLSEYKSEDALESAFVETFQLKDMHGQWTKYARSIYGFCVYLKEHDLDTTEKLSAYITENSQTLEKRLALIDELTAIYDVGMAVASNFLKEAGFEGSNSYSLYSKPDTHMINIMYSCGFIKSYSDIRCFIAVDELSGLCDMTPYTIDKILYCSDTENYYKFPSIKNFRESLHEYFNR